MQYGEYDEVLEGVFDNYHQERPAASFRKSRDISARPSGVSLAGELKGVPAAVKGDLFD